MLRMQNKPTFCLVSESDSTKAYKFTKPSSHLIVNQPTTYSLKELYTNDDAVIIIHSLKILKELADENKCPNKLRFEPKGLELNDSRNAGILVNILKTGNVKSGFELYMPCYDPGLETIKVFVESFPYLPENSMINFRLTGISYAAAKILVNALKHCPKRLKINLESIHETRSKEMYDALKQSLDEGDALNWPDQFTLCIDSAYEPLIQSIASALSNGKLTANFGIEINDPVKESLEKSEMTILEALNSPNCPQGIRIKPHAYSYHAKSFMSEKKYSFFEILNEWKHVHSLGLDLTSLDHKYISHIINDLKYNKSVTSLRICLDFQTAPLCLKMLTMNDTLTELHLEPVENELWNCPTIIRDEILRLIDKNKHLSREMHEEAAEALEAKSFDIFYGIVKRNVALLSLRLKREREPRLGDFLKSYLKDPYRQQLIAALGEKNFEELRKRLTRIDNPEEYDDMASSTNCCGFFSTLFLQTDPVEVKQVDEDVKPSKLNMY